MFFGGGAERADREKGVNICGIQTAIIRVLHSKNCGVKSTPPVLIEDHTMHLTPVLNLWC